MALFVAAGCAFVVGCRSNSGDIGRKAPVPAPVEEETAPPLEEDPLGVIGAPNDETEFEFEPEMSTGAYEIKLAGVPEIPADVMTGLEPFLDSRRARLQAIGGRGQFVLMITRQGETAQAFRLDEPNGTPRQVTFGDEPVVQVSSVPGVAHAVTYRSDFGGNEDFQILRLDRQQGAVLLTDGESRNTRFSWSSGSRRMAFTSNLRNGVDMDVFTSPAERDSSPELVLEREGSWSVSNWSPDGTQLILRKYTHFNFASLHLFDVASGEVSVLGTDEPGVTYDRARFAGLDTVFVTSNRDGEFIDLFRVDLETDTWTNLTSDLEWDVDEITFHAGSGRLAFTINENGVSKLFVTDREGSDRRLVDLPIGIVSSLKFARDGELLAFTFDSPTRPGEVWTYDLDTGKESIWTDSRSRQLRDESFVEPRPVTVESFDGTPVSAWVYTPAGEGPHPVMLWIHGGPEDQYQPTFNPFIQYLVTRLGVAVVAPNIRGSTGYGKTFVGLDNGLNRENSIKDIGALLDWIASEPRLDASRVGIHGASYGGYVVLASMVHYPDKIVAGSDMVGISNFVTFLENTRGYRVDQRRAEYGDEREPEMRAFLERISPATNAGQIRRPLFVAHGANDPRVPLGEATQVFEAVQSNGVEAWLMVAHDEGHGFAKRYNRDTFYRTLATFVLRHVVGEKIQEEAVADEEEATDEGGEEGSESASEEVAP